MDFKQAVIRCVRDKYADFNGRARRSEYWLFVLFLLIVQIVARLLSWSVGGDLEHDPFGSPASAVTRCCSGWRTMPRPPGFRSW